MRELTIETVITMSAIIVPTTGTITFVLKLTRFLRVLSIGLRFWQPSDPQNEIGFYVTLFRHHDFLGFGRETRMPGPDRIFSGRDIFDGEASFVVRDGEEGIFQHEHDAAHPAVNRTKHIHPARFLELDGLTVM